MKEEKTFLPTGFHLSIRTLAVLIPFSGEFSKCSAKDFRDAAAELFVTTFFATMPLWIMPLLGPILFRTEISFVDHLLSTVRGGELFVYCAALVGPLIYIITKRYGEIDTNDNKFNLIIAFPHGLTFVLVSALICIFAGFAFSLMKNPVFSSDQQIVPLNVGGIFWTSIGCYLFSSYAFFAASAYRNAMSDFVNSNASEEDEFAATWEMRSDASDT